MSLSTEVLSTDKSSKQQHRRQESGKSTNERISTWLCDYRQRKGHPRILPGILANNTSSRCQLCCTVQQLFRLEASSTRLRCTWREARDNQHFWNRCDGGRYYCVCTGTTVCGMLLMIIAMLPCHWIRSKQGVFCVATLYNHD